MEDREKAGAPEASESPPGGGRSGTGDLLSAEVAISFIASLLVLALIDGQIATTTQARRKPGPSVNIGRSDRRSLRKRIHNPYTAEYRAAGKVFAV